MNLLERIIRLSSKLDDKKKFKAALTKMEEKFGKVVADVGERAGGYELQFFPGFCDDKTGYHVIDQLSASEVVETIKRATKCHCNDCEKALYG